MFTLLFGSETRTLLSLRGAVPTRSFLVALIWFQNFFWISAAGSPSSPTMVLSMWFQYDFLIIAWTVALWEVYSSRSLALLFFCAPLKSLSRFLMAFLILWVIHGRDCFLDVICLVGMWVSIAWSTASLKLIHIASTSQLSWLAYLSQNPSLKFDNEAVNPSILPLWYKWILRGVFLFSLTRVLISKNGISWSEMPGIISIRLTISGRFVKNRSSTDDVVDVVRVGLSTIWDKPLSFAMSINLLQSVVYWLFGVGDAVRQSISPRLKSPVIRTWCFDVSIWVMVLLRAWRYTGSVIFGGR